MSANVETMAYRNEIPWHGLGEYVEGVKTPEEMAVLGGVDWTVSVRPVTTVDPNTGETIRIKDFRAIVRDSDNSVFGHAGPRWVPVQNLEALEFFKKFTEAGGMEMETVGALNGGRTVWGLAKIGQNFELVSGDKVEGYLLLVNPHVFGKTLDIMFTPIRVVCQNTLTMAMKGASNLGGIFSHRHNRAFSEEIQLAAEQALGISANLLDGFKQQSELLLETAVTNKMYKKFMARVFSPLAEDKQTGAVNVEKFNRTVPKIAELISTQPGAEYGKGSLWSLLNATTYYYDHDYGRTTDARLTQGWFGTTAKIKKRALDVGLELAVAA